MANRTITLTCEDREFPGEVIAGDLILSIIEYLDGSTTGFPWYFMSGEPVESFEFDFKSGGEYQLSSTRLNGDNLPLGNIIIYTWREP